MGPQLYRCGPAALPVALAALALGSPAFAQKPVVFHGNSPTVVAAFHTRNGVPFFPPTTGAAIPLPYLVLYHNGTFGYLPSAGTFVMATTGFPVFGSVAALPGGSLQLSGNVTPFQNGNTRGSQFVTAVLFESKGQFYAYITTVGTSSSPTSTGQVTDVDTFLFLTPLSVVSD
jgi:hypothetical protein